MCVLGAWELGSCLEGRQASAGERTRKGGGGVWEKKSLVEGGLAGETRCPVKMRDEVEGMGDFCNYINIVELLDERK